MERFGRRSWLSTVGTSAFALIAGCATVDIGGDEQEPGGNGSGDGTPTDERTNATEDGFLDVETMFNHRRWLLEPDGDHEPSYTLFRLADGLFTDYVPVYRALEVPAVEAASELVSTFEQLDPDVESGFSDLLAIEGRDGTPAIDDRPHFVALPSPEYDGEWGEELLAEVESVAETVDQVETTSPVTEEFFGVYRLSGSVPYEYVAVGRFQAVFSDDRLAIEAIVETPAEAGRQSYVEAFDPWVADPNAPSDVLGVGVYRPGGAAPASREIQYLGGFDRSSNTLPTATLDAQLVRTANGDRVDEKAVESSLAALPGTGDVQREASESSQTWDHPYAKASTTIDLARLESESEYERAAHDAVRIAAFVELDADVVTVENTGVEPLPTDTLTLEIGTTRTVEHDLGEETDGDPIEPGEKLRIDAYNGVRSAILDHDDRGRLHGDW